jgi:hypothetical protein
MKTEIEQGHVENSTEIIGGFVGLSVANGAKLPTGLPSEAKPVV